MSLEINRDTVFVDMRLTSLGRQLASLGRLRFKKVVLSDNEVDYRYETPYYQLDDNLISSPPDIAQSIGPFNFDGTPAIQLGPNNLIRGKSNNEERILDQPFFASANTRMAIDVGKCLALGSSLVSDMVGTSVLNIESITAILVDQDTVHESCVGNLIMIRHHASASGSLDHFGNQPFVSLWYRINSWDGGDNFTLDRALPNFAAGSDQILWFVYPWSGASTVASGATATTESFFVTSGEYTGPIINTGIEGPYGGYVYTNDGSAAITTGLYYASDHWEFYASSTLMYSADTGTETDPAQVLVWNNVNGSDPKPLFGKYNSGARLWSMNILRTVNEIGSTGGTTGYTSYGSTHVNGTKRMFGFDSDQRTVGFIHQTDPTIDIDRTDRLQLSSTTLYLPTLLWHRKPEYKQGSATKGGHAFTDKSSLLYYDPVAQLSYSKLMDSPNIGGIEVGRVYHDIRMMVITHQDLLNAMSYKSNRNWTLPEMKTSISENYIPNTTGLCKSDKVYLTTYVMSATTTYSSGSSFSYRNFIHCGNISKLEGIDGGPYTILARFTGAYFPYMRTVNKITAFSGTGWNANQFNILIKEVDKADFSGLSSVSSSGWKKLNTGGEYSNQNSETTISSSGLTSYQFAITQVDYDNASDYSLASLSGDMGDRTFSGLSYGDETFFFGSVEYDINKDPEKMAIQFSLLPNAFNSTTNRTFGPDNENVFITGIHILDDLDRVVGIAKPSGPIRKSYDRYVEFKLDLIY